jgi:general secretion pathway protein D
VPTEEPAPPEHPVNPPPIKVSTTETKKKTPPIKPVINPVHSGLLSPSTQEIPEGSPPLPQKERQKVVFNFEKADIAEVTSQIFGDQLKLNYVMDQSLQGRISMYIEGDFDTQELLRMVTRAYEANGVSIIPRKGFYYIQASSKPATGLSVADPMLLKADKENPRPIIVIYRLRYMDPKQAWTLITPFLSAGKKGVVEPLTNSVIFVEDTDNARSLVNLLKTIDINILQEISMEIVPLNNIAAQDAVQGMESLMGKLGGLKESSIKNSLAFLPLSNFGGVLVMAQTPELLKSAKQWLQALDAKGVGSTEEIYVYFIQNGLARDITDILNSAFGLGGGGGGRMAQQVVPSGRTATGNAFGGGTSMFGGGGGTGGGTGGTTGFGGSLGGTSGTGGVAGSTFGTSATRGGGTTTGGISAASTQAAGGGKPVTKVFTGEVTIISDEVNNAIVVRANAIDYAKIKKTIENLDLLPRAVLIEVMVAEVVLTKDFKYGIQYWFQTHPQNQAGFGVSFNGLSNNTTAATTVAGSTTAAATTTTGFPNLGALASSGIAMSWIANARDLAIFINALSSKTTVNVLSTPTLLATDNKEASIAVGGREPVPTGSYAGGTSTTGSVTNVFSTIDYAETGVLLHVTPHINAGGLVRLEVEQTIRRTNPTSATVGQGNTAPTFTERNVKTTLLAQSGNTVVIGGIIDSSRTSGKSGIPFLQDIPIISPLFSTTTNDLARTELLIAITPHVIDQRGSEAPRELLQKLQNLRQRVGY